MRPAEPAGQDATGGRRGPDTSSVREGSAAGGRNPPLLAGLRTVEIGGGLAGAVCGRLFAELGAAATCVHDAGQPDSPALRLQGFLKRHVTIDGESSAGRTRLFKLLESADVIITTLHPLAVEAGKLSADRLQESCPAAVIVSITAFGLTGPRSTYKGGDLVAFHASGTARLLTGQSDDPSASPPVRAAGEQSEFVAGITAACAAMHALHGRARTARGQLVDVSVQEAMACIAVQELALPAYGKPPTPRKRVLDGGGATVCILPTSDGFFAISPREEHQWQAWLGVIGSPLWAADPRFATRQARIENFDALYPLLCEWSKGRTREEAYRAAQAAHVASFPLSQPADLLRSAQLRHRGFFQTVKWDDGKNVEVPGAPYVVRQSAARAATPDAGHIQHRQSGRLPLDGVRVVDFSWVIAGPACTRYLAAMGADVIKVETSMRADPGRGSELHAVLGQSKSAITLDLKKPEGLDLARRLIAKSDLVVENFATGVMERLGLGYGDLSALRPGIVMVSASAFGRTGPDAAQVGYGTLIQCYTGFAAMNGHPGEPPRVGMAWADPVCGLLMAFAAVAALDARRRTGQACHIDFSMVEALLSTMPGPLVEFQLSGRTPGPEGNADPRFFPHGVYRCAGDDAWVAIAVSTEGEWQALCQVVGLPARMASLDYPARIRARANIDEALGEWAAARGPVAAMEQLQSAGVPASASYDAAGLFTDPHLRERGFYKAVEEPGRGSRRLPGLPWRLANGVAPIHLRAPDLGQDTAAVLSRVLDLNSEEIARLRKAGALE